MSPSVPHLPRMLVPFRVQPFLHKYLHLLGAEPQRLTVLRHIAMQLSLAASHQVGWTLDEIVASDWRATPMRGPIFIIGHQRSGTTYLQRLLAADADHIRSLTLLDIMLPNVAVQRIFRAAVGALVGGDAARARELDEGVHKVEDRLFGRIKRMHDLRFNEPAEDEFVLWSIFASITCLNDSPRSSTMTDPYHLRDFSRWSEREQARAFGWYKACLLKKLYREPGPADFGPLWMVSKNPAFTHKIHHLRECFPDARFIYLVRSPLETIPSRLSLIREIWATRFSRFREMSGDQVQAILEDSYRTYRVAEAQLESLPQHAVVVVRYSDLRKDPAAVLGTIYERFDIPGTGASPAPPPQQVSGNRYTSHHTYSLEEFSLREADVRADLSAIFERYDF